MSVVRFIGCLHFGHKWLAKYRGFQDDFYHDEHIIDTWNSVVNKKDLTYILGDITMESSKPYPLLDRLNGRKIVVLGNHDRHQDVRELLNYVDSVGGTIQYKGFVLTHVPIHPNEIGFSRGNIHAHIHHTNFLEEVIVNDRYGDINSKRSKTLHKYHNVDAHIIGYKPQTLEQLMESKKDG
jgi:calcineurin-like phosphoesterase family protein